MNIRVIPRLDVKGSNLVKGIHMEGLRVLGKPHQFAKYYYQNGADDLFYQDVVASLYERNSILDIIKTTSSETFIPLTVGGGLRTLEDIHAALRCGADKVSLNTAAVKRPSLIEEAAKTFGSSTVVVSIDAKKRPDGTFEAYIDFGRERTKLDVVKLAQRSADLGAGEIVVTSIDQEGTTRGYDVELIRSVSESVSIPVIGSGGAGTVEHVVDAAREGLADGICIASAFHYSLLDRRPELASEQFKEGLRHRVFDGLTLSEVKMGLRNAGLECREIA